MTSVNCTTIFQREWSSPMHHNSEFHSALGDETGKQQAAITPHTGGPEQRHQGEGTWNHWLGQLSSCLAQQNNYALHPHTSCLGCLPKHGKPYRKSRGLLGPQGLSTSPDQFRFMAKKAAGHLCLLSLYRMFWLEMPTPQSLSSHQENHTLQAVTVQHKPPIAPNSLTTATCLYTSFSFSFHPSKKVCINFLACQVLVKKKVSTARVKVRTWY